MEAFGITQKDITVLEEIFRKYSSVKLVHIFGSRAKGNFKPTSDIDLAIMNKNVSRDTAYQIKSDFQDSNIPYVIDLVNLEDISNKELIDHIKRVGIPIYSRKS